MDFLNSCFQYDISKRLTIMELREHPFIKNSSVNYAESVSQTGSYLNEMINKSNYLDRKKKRKKKKNRMSKQNMLSKEIDSIQESASEFHPETPERKKGLKLNSDFGPRGNRFRLDKNGQKSIAYDECEYSYESKPNKSSVSIGPRDEVKFKEKITKDIGNIRNQQNELLDDMMGSEESSIDNKPGDKFDKLKKEQQCLLDDMMGSEESSLDNKSVDIFEKLKQEQKSLLDDMMAANQSSSQDEDDYSASKTKTNKSVKLVPIDDEIEDLKKDQSALLNDMMDSSESKSDLENINFEKAAERIEKEQKDLMNDMLMSDSENSKSDNYSKQSEKVDIKPFNISIDELNKEQEELIENMLGTSSHSKMSKVNEKQSNNQKGSNNNLSYTNKNTNNSNNSKKFFFQQPVNLEDSNEISIQKDDNSNEESQIELNYKINNEANVELSFEDDVNKPLPENKETNSIEKYHEKEKKNINLTKLNFNREEKEKSRLLFPDSRDSMTPNSSNQNKRVSQVSLDNSYKIQMGNILII